MSIRGKERVSTRGYLMDITNAIEYFVVMVETRFIMRSQQKS